MLPTTRPGEDSGTNKTGGDHTYGGRTTITPPSGLRVVIPSAKIGVRGRIMPALPHNVMSTSDSAFKEQVLPYRDAAVICPNTGHPVWSWWFFDKFEVHRFWGPQNRSFVSPRTLRAFGETNKAKTMDPIDRMNWLANNEAKWSDYKILTEFTMTKGVERPLTLPQRLGFCNFYGTYGDTQIPEVFLLGLTTGGFKFITGQLNKAPSSRSPAHDPNWPDYMFGDVTDPKTGLYAWSVQKEIPGGRSANTLAFSELDDFLKGEKVMEIHKDALKERCNFFDLQNEIHVATPEEIVHYLVDDTELPLEFIKEAVGDYVAVPSKRSPSTVSSPAPATEPPDEEPEDIRPMPTANLPQASPAKEEPKAAAAPQGAAMSEDDMRRFAELETMKNEGTIGQNPELYMEYFKLEAMFKASKA